MITLYGWGPMFDCPSPSAFVMKSDMQLQMLGVDFKRAIADLDAVPKHKAPYLYDGDTLIQDSNFIRAYFEKQLGRSLDDGLSAQETAASWALERMAEGHLSDCMLCERWLKDENFFKGPVQFFMSVPEPAREQLCAEIRTQMKADMESAGFGRHSEHERLQLSDWDIKAIALALGDKDYLFGSSPVAADASVSAVLISSATEYFNTPLTELINRHANLVAYIDRVKKRFFATNKWPVPEMAM